jgi:hypothetical protein
VRRFEVRERGCPPLPAIDLADETVVIGSGPDARIRLPATAARDAHVRIEGERWIAIADVVVDGRSRAAGEAGPTGDTRFEVGDYEVRVARAPSGVPASPPQRTESLARELVRGLLGAGSAPALERPDGARRELAPPESRLVIGRGDEADWVILDEELSREHAELRCGWDGTTIRDLGSKNGTRVAGRPITEPVALHDGARIELGALVLVFRDPAERHLRGEPADGPAPAPVPVRPVTSPAPPTARSSVPFVVAAAIATLAALGLGWIVLGA